MVICRYFQQGTCRFGTSCRNDHIYNNPYSYQSNTKPQNVQSVQPIQQQNMQNPQNDIANQIRIITLDMVAAEQGKQWLLSCYGPFKFKPNFPNFEDQSFEEIRWMIYNAQKQGNSDSMIQLYKRQTEEARQKYKFYQTGTRELIEIFKNIYLVPDNTKNTSNFGQSNSLFNPPNTASANQTNRSMFGGSVSQQTPTNQFNQAPNTLFGGGAATQSFAFNTQPSMFGGANSNTTPNTSLFPNNQNNQSTSVFGTSQPKTQPLFGSPTNSPLAQTSIFATNNTPRNTNVFGSNQTNSPFGTAQPANSSPFGTAQPANSSPFGTAQPTNVSPFGQNVFGTPQATNTSPFGAPQTNKNVFGTPQPAKTSPLTQNVFGTPQTATNSPFAQNTFGTSQPTSPLTQNVFGTNPGQQSVFGSNQTQPTQNVFGSNQTQPTQNVFGSNQAPTTQQSVFGSNQAPTTQQSVFGSNQAPTTQQSVFGSNQAPTTQQSVFSPNQQQSQNMFGSNQQTQNVFGSNQAPSPQQTQNVFGSNPVNPLPQNTSIFAKNPTNVSPFAASPNNIFSQNTNGNVFPAQPVPPQQNSNIFATNPSVLNLTTSNNQQSVFGSTIPVNAQTSIKANPKPKTEESDGAYSKLEELAEADLTSFRSDRFTFGSIPISPPPLSLCVN